MGEKRIEIVSDVDGKIVYEEILTDEISRAEVASVEARIAELEAQKLAIEDQLTELRAKIKYAKNVISIADAKKLAEEELAKEEGTEEVAE